ncbi:MAG: DUF4416 family protein [Pseudomonadota bacterium]
MSLPTEPDPAQLILSILSARESPVKYLEKHLIAAFGNLEDILGPLKFDFTKYYDVELGSGIKRWVVAFNRLVDPSQLAHFKILTNSIEEEWSSRGRRQFNLDPGVMSLGNFVLATGKNNAHRIYLNHGIFADLTLVFRRSSYQPLEWTYPDYADSELIGLLNHIREKYKEKLEKQR